MMACPPRAVAGAHARGGAPSRRTRASGRMCRRPRARGRTPRTDDRSTRARLTRTTTVRVRARPLSRPQSCLPFPEAPLSAGGGDGRVSLVFPLSSGRPRRSLAHHRPPGRRERRRAGGARGLGGGWSPSRPHRAPGSTSRWARGSCRRTRLAISRDWAPFWACGPLCGGQHRPTACPGARYHRRARVHPERPRAGATIRGGGCGRRGGRDLRPRRRH